MSSPQAARPIPLPFRKRFVPSGLPPEQPSDDGAAELAGRALAIVEARRHARILSRPRESPRRQKFEVGTGVGTPRAFLTYLAHLTHGFKRFPRSHPAVNGPGRDRTCDLGIKSPLLYQLSYRPA
jgi:hypothetical protein